MRIGNPLARVPVETFNRACRWGALLWLLVTVPAALAWRPTISDFPQFYAGGLMVRLGEADSLYPLSTSKVENPGLPQHSNLRPAEAALRRQYRVPDFTRFMLPPPSALLFVPLTVLSYENAGRAWTVIMTLCAWGVALYAAQFCRLLAGAATRAEGGLILLIVLCPMVIRAIRVGNTTPAVALLIAVGTGEILRRDGPRAAAAIIVGGLLKYATGVLVPLLFLLRRWRTLAWTVAIGLAAVSLSVAVMGTEPYRVFLTEISPTLDRPSRFRGNQSLAGFLLRAKYRGPLSANAKAGLLAVQSAVLLALAMLVMAQAKRRRIAPPAIFAAATALIAWMIAFSPISWEHYPIFLCPFWPWLIHEARGSIVRTIAAWGGILLTYFPITTIPLAGLFAYRIFFPEPVNSLQLWGVLLILAFTLSRLYAWLREDLGQPALAGAATGAGPAERQSCAGRSSSQ